MIDHETIKALDRLRSRLANARKHQPDAKLNLYAMNDRGFADVCVVGIASCSEQLLELCHEVGLRDWTLGNTTCRSIIRNVIGGEEGPRIVEVIGLNNERPKFEPQTGVAAEPPRSPESNQRTKHRKEKRRAARARMREEENQRKLSLRFDPSEDHQSGAQ